MSVPVRACVICGALAAKECNGALGVHGCYAPLCARHTADDHHPDDKAWREYQATSLCQHHLAKGTSVDYLWYAFMAGYRAGRRATNT